MYICHLLPFSFPRITTNCLSLNPVLADLSLQVSLHWGCGVWGLIFCLSACFLHSCLYPIALCFPNLCFKPFRLVLLLFPLLLDLIHFKVTFIKKVQVSPGLLNKSGQIPKTNVHVQFAKLTLMAQNILCCLFSVKPSRLIQWEHPASSPRNPGKGSSNPGLPVGQLIGWNNLYLNNEFRKRRVFCRRNY